MTKKLFLKIERTFSLLEIIHSDICELNDILTRGGKWMDWMDLGWIING